VRCPKCGGRFVVTAVAQAAPEPATGPRGAEAAPRARSAPRRAPGSDGAGVASAPPRAEVARAAAIVAALAGRHGRDIAQAWTAGRLFSSCGAELLAAWDAYRAASAGACAAAFRIALRDRLGVDLEGPPR
jgi:hypothetical protein